jgi:hypothetical protein
VVARQLTANRPVKAAMPGVVVENVEVVVSGENLLGEVAHVGNRATAPPLISTAAAGCSDRSTCAC